MHISIFQKQSIYKAVYSRMTINSNVFVILLIPQRSSSSSLNLHFFIQFWVAMRIVTLTIQIVTWTKCQRLSGLPWAGLPWGRSLWLPVVGTLELYQLLPRHCRAVLVKYRFFLLRGLQFPEFFRGQFLFQIIQSHLLHLHTSSVPWVGAMGVPWGRFLWLPAYQIAVSDSSASRSTTWFSISDSSSLDKAI